MKAFRHVLRLLLEVLDEDEDVIEPNLWSVLHRWNLRHCLLLLELELELVDEDVEDVELTEPAFR